MMDENSPEFVFTVIKRFIRLTPAAVKQIFMMRCCSMLAASVAAAAVTLPWSTLRH